MNTYKQAQFVFHSVFLLIRKSENLNHTENMLWIKQFLFQVVSKNRFITGAQQRNTQTLDPPVLSAEQSYLVMLFSGDLTSVGGDCIPP